MVKVIIELFTTPTCPHCQPAKKKVQAFLDYFEGKRPGMLAVVKYDASTPIGAEKARGYGISTVPTVVVKGPANEFLLDAINEPTLEKAVLVAAGEEE